MGSILKEVVVLVKCEWHGDALVWLIRNLSQLSTMIKIVKLTLVGASRANPKITESSVGYFLFQRILVKLEIRNSF